MLSPFAAIHPSSILVAGHRSLKEGCVTHSYLLPLLPGKASTTNYHVKLMQHRACSFSLSIASRLVAIFVGKAGRCCSSPPLECSVIPVASGVSEEQELIARGRNAERRRYEEGRLSLTAIIQSSNTVRHTDVHDFWTRLTGATDSRIIHTPNTLPELAGSGCTEACDLQEVRKDECDKKPTRGIRNCANYKRIDDVLSREKG